MNKMQGGDLGLQDRIQIYNASYSYYQPCHAAAEIFSASYNHAILFRQSVL